MRDHLLSWHEKFQPLGPALKTPRIEVEEKSAIAEFEERSFDHPACTGGNAPSLSPQAPVPSPAAQVFKVGDSVEVFQALVASGAQSFTDKPFIGKVGKIASDMVQSSDCGNCIPVTFDDVGRQMVYVHNLRTHLPALRYAAMGGVEGWVSAGAGRCSRRYTGARRPCFAWHCAWLRVESPRGLRLRKRRHRGLPSGAVMDREPIPEFPPLDWRTFVVAVAVAIAAWFVSGLP
jgi:hypothetical protein